MGSIPLGHRSQSQSINGEARSHFLPAAFFWELYKRHPKFISRVILFRDFQKIFNKVQAYSCV